MTVYSTVPTSDVPSGADARLYDSQERIVATSSFPDARDLASHFTGPATRYAAAGSYQLEYDTDDGPVRFGVTVAAAGSAVSSPPTPPLTARVQTLETGLGAVTSGASPSLDSFAEVAGAISQTLTTATGRAAAFALLGG